MSIEHLLEDFGSTRTNISASVSDFDEEEVETRRLAAFEEGYQAGWDDAIGAHTKDKLRVTSDLAQNLLDMSFTYNEAYTHIFRELRPLLFDIVAKLLPQMMRQTIGPRIVEELEKSAAENITREALVIVAPDLVTVVESLVEKADSFPVSVRGDSSLAEGQAQLTLADREVELNLNQMITEISAALEAFTHDLQKEDLDERKQAI